MSRAAALLVVALLGSFAPAHAGVEPSARWKYANPFCKVIAAVAALGDGKRYAVALSAEGGTTISAHVTLVSATDAYAAAVPDMNLEGSMENRELPAIVFALPSADKIEYYFVDSYAIDRGASVTCPSYVFPIDAPIAAPAGEIATIAAQHLQALGKLPCGRIYQDVGAGGYLGDMVGHYGNRRLSVTFHVYVDSAGHAIREQLLESSGVEGIDATALGSIQEHQYVAARFLCTPVVGELNIRMDYVP